MNRPERILTVLEPPPGRLERLRARRDSRSWWAFASGSPVGVAWLAIAPGHTQIRMQLTGGRPIGERGHGVGVQILGNGRVIALPSPDEDVRIYWVESTASTPAK